MTDTPEQLAIAAAEADRLRQDPAFQRAVLSLRADAVNALVSVDPTDVETIRTKQAEIRAIDGLCQEIANAILRAPRKPMAVA